MNKRQLGTSKENLAGVYLHASGVQNLTYNYRCRYGEIDIIGYDKDTLVFFEVKYRSHEDKGYASEAVDIRKQFKICRVSDHYRMIHHINDYTPMRFDVIAIDGDNIDWICNAFEYLPRT